MRANRLVDSHCHLHSLPPGERAPALRRARSRGVGGFLVPATRLDQAEEVLDLCHRHADLWCALGIHPHEAASWRRGDQERLDRLLNDPRAVAVGECGLDFHYENAPRDLQVHVLRAQWELALELSLPVVVHNRESDKEMLRLVEDRGFDGLQADFHSFAGNDGLLEAVLRRDFYVGVSGMVTFKRAENIRRIVRAVPLNRLLIETDTPYLTPEPHRGKRNQPAWVVEVCQGVASVREESAEQIEGATTANFERLFGTELPSHAAQAQPTSPLHDDPP